MATKVEVNVPAEPQPNPHQPATEKERERSRRYGRRGGYIKGKNSGAYDYDAWDDLQAKAGATGFLGIKEVFENPAPGVGEQTTWVGRRGFLPTAILADGGVEALKEELDQRWGPGVWSITRLDRDSWSARTVDDSKGESYPEVSLATGEMKRLMPPSGEEFGDGRESREDPFAYDPQVEEIETLKRQEAIEMQRQRLESLMSSRKTGGGGGDNAVLAALIAGQQQTNAMLMAELLKPKPEPRSFDVEAMKAIFSAQQQANQAMVNNLMLVQSKMAEAQADMSRRMMREMTGFMLDSMRHSMQMPEDDGGLSGWEKLAMRGINVLDKAVSSGKVRQEPQHARALPQARPGDAEAQRVHRIRNIFKLFAIEASNRPEPEVFVERHIVPRIAMMHEDDRKQLLGFISTFGTGDFTAVSNMLSWFAGHGTPGVKEFQEFLGSNNLAQQWTAQVLSALADHYSPEEPEPEREEPEPEEDSPTNGTVNDTEPQVPEEDGGEEGEE